MGVPLTPDDVCNHVVQQLAAVGGGASRAELHRWGVDRAALNRLLRRGMVHRQGRGYYVLPWAGHDDDRWRRERSEHLRRVSAAANSEKVAGLRSAALAWGLPVSSVPPLPEILRPAHAASLQGTRVVRRPPDPEHIVLINTVHVTSLERTAVDVSLDLPTPQALITVDAVLRRGADLHLMMTLLRSLGPVHGCRRAHQTLIWADGHSESPLESFGRGRLLLQGIPQPSSNISLRLDGQEFRTDHWWDDLGIAGEADGRGKYNLPTSSHDTLWAEKLRQEWFEDALGLSVVRYVEREVRLAPHAVAARWERRAAQRLSKPWMPPVGLEVFQRPISGTNEPIRWLRRP